MNKIEVNNKEFELFLENESIAKRIRLIGIQVNVDYDGRCPMLIGILNGSFLFMADLIKEIDIACEIGFMKVSSYEGIVSSGNIKQVFGMPSRLEGRDVIIVEDIIDSGHTLKYILDELDRQKPASVAVCSLLFKPNAVQQNFEVLKYVGFEIPNEFVVGYGLDYDGLGRNLKDIYRAV